MDNTNKISLELNAKVLWVIGLVALSFFCGKYYGEQAIAKTAEVTEQASETPNEELGTPITAAQLIDSEPSNSVIKVEEDTVVDFNGMKVPVPAGYGYLEYQNSTKPCVVLIKDQDAFAIFAHHDTEMVTDAASFIEAIKLSSVELFTADILSYEKQPISDESSGTLLSVHDVAGHYLYSIGELNTSGISSILMLNDDENEPLFVSEFLRLSGATEEFYTNVKQQLTDLKTKQE